MVAGSGPDHGAAPSIDEALKRARQRLRRVEPEQAYTEMSLGAILVDIRPMAQRQAEGCVPGALVVERNVLEWRFDPRSGSRLPEAVDYHVRLIIMCSEGYASSLAASALQDLGLGNATDLIGGYVAWANAGLPVLRRHALRPASNPQIPARIR